MCFKAGDKFVSVDGKETSLTRRSLRTVLSTKKAGDKVAVTLVRGRQIETIACHLSARPARARNTPKLGVTVGTGCLLPFEVTLSLSGIGGPSAGLMFSLGIIDKISTMT